MKDYSCWDINRATDEARHRDGRPQTQVSVAVRAPSLAAAARAIGVTAHHLRTYGGETGNQPTHEALDDHEPGTVLVRAMDPGGTVKGESGWVVR